MSGTFTGRFGGHMAVKEELESEAKRLRALTPKRSYEAIAEQLGVNEKTVRRWAKDWDSSKASPKAQVIEAESYVILDTSDREWPGWTVDDLAAMHLPGVFRPDLWVVNIELIHVAERRGNVYVPWFFRNLIELGRRQNMPDGSLPWSLAIAGLPGLGEWLDCPPCTGLGELVEKHQPWVGRRQRAVYQREARTVADAVKQCVFQAHARSVMEDYAEDRKEPSRLTKALATLYKRTPEFAQRHFMVRQRADRLGKQIIDILTAPQED